MDTADYIVTDLAGPKVAGLAAKSGDILPLTDAQARAELLAGAIVPKGDAKKPPKASEIFKGSEKLADIQARAAGKDGADAPEAAPAEIKQTAPPPKTPAAPLAPATDVGSGGLGADPSKPA